jgi:hypothetical protein
MITGQHEGLFPMSSFSSHAAAEPAGERPPRPPRPILAAARLLPFVVLVVALLIAAGVYFRFAPVCFAVARFSGREVWLDTPVLQLHDVESGEEASAAVVFRNYSPSTVTVIGANVSCHCTTAGGLPAVVLPGESIHLPVRITTTETQSVLEEKITYFVGDRDAVKRFPVVVRAVLRQQ